MQRKVGYVVLIVVGAVIIFEVAEGANHEQEKYLVEMYQLLRRYDARPDARSTFDNSHIPHSSSLDVLLITLKQTSVLDKYISHKLLRINPNHIGNS